MARFTQEKFLQYIWKSNCKIPFVQKDINSGLEPTDHAIKDTVNKEDG